MREILRKFQMDLERLKRMDLYAAVNYIRRGMGYDEYLVRTAAEKGTDKNELLKEAEWFQKQVRQFRSLEQLKEHIALYEDVYKRQARINVSANGYRAKHFSSLCPVFIEIADYPVCKGSPTVNPTGFHERCLP